MQILTSNNLLWIFALRRDDMHIWFGKTGDLLDKIKILPFGQIWLSSKLENIRHTNYLQLKTLLSIFFI